MIDGDLVIEHLNALNTVISQSLLTDIKVMGEDTWISLLCSFLDSWDSLVMAIGSKNTTQKIHDVAATLV